MNGSPNGYDGGQSDLAAFDRDGFIGPLRLFSHGQCDLITQSIQVDAHPDPVAWPKGRAADDRLYYDLATRPALAPLLRFLLGDNIVLWGVDVIERVPGQIHPWHSDIESAGPENGFVSVWVGIENTSRESALQMVARSHRFGSSVQQMLHERGLRRGEASDETIAAWAREFDPQAALIQPEMANGDAIVYDGRLWHATNNRRPEGRRLALLLQYASADRPARMPDFSKPGWPFQLTRLPCWVYSTRSRRSI